jgi:hypothetical protein
MSVARAALNTAAWLGGFIAVCQAIGALLPFPDVPAVKAKLEHFRQHAQEYDTLFLGTSRINHHILPSVFDPLTAACGLRTKSFNLGVDSMRPPETDYLIDQVLAARPKNLRWIFIENNPIRLSIETQRRGTVRAGYWHDLKRMAVLARTAFLTRERPKKFRLGKWLQSWVEPLGDLWPHVPLFAGNFVNIGRASILVARLSDEPPEEGDPLGIGEHGDGFLETGRGEVIAPAQLRELERNMAERRAKAVEIDYGDEPSQRNSEALLTRLEKTGARIIQLIPPTTGRRKFHVRTEAKGQRLVFDYSDIEKYAVLYEPRHRIDPDHLNHAGAELFTRTLAQEFCAAIEGKR